MKLSTEKYIGKAPLLLPVVCILLASLTYYSFGFNFPQMAVLAVFLLIAGMLLFIKKKQFALVIILCFLFFYIRIQIHENDAINIEQYKSLDRKIIQIDGVVEDIPSLDWNKSFKEKRSVAFLIKLQSKKGQNSHVYQKIFVYENAKSKILPGDHVSIIGEFRLPQKNRIPGGFNTYDYYKKKNWVGNLRVKGWDAVDIKSSHWHWRRWLFQIRKLFYEQTIKKFPKTSSGFVASVVIGYKDDLNKTQISQFQNLGIAHVFAISGLHLGLIALWTWWFGGFFIISLRKRTLLTLLLTLLYCLISGASLSSIRAFIMLACFLGGYLFNKRANVWNNFSLSIILLFLWNPAIVLSVGFQLSYLAVLSILVAHFVLTRNKEINAFELLEPKSFKRTLKKKIFELLFYSLMISITTGMITSYHFNVISYGSIFLNLLVIPYFTLVLGITFFFSIFSFILPQFIFVLPDLFIRFLFFVPDVVGDLITSHRYVQSPNEYLILFFILCFLLLNTFKLRMVKMVGLNIGYYLIVLAALFISQEPPKNQLVVLDVGKAQAIHVQTKKGGDFLFDCGTRSGYDSISPYLKYKGINELDAVYVSHDNADHFNCWPTIFNRFKIHKLFAKTSALGNSTSFNRMMQLKGVIIPKNISVNTKSNIEGSTFTCLHPDNKKYPNKNEESVVWLTSLGWCEVLFPGDIQNKGIQDLIQKPLLSKTKKRILIAPHHGRNVSYLNDLIKWFDPDLILVSGDRLSEDVKQQLSVSSVPVVMTGDMGTIVINETNLNENSKLNILTAKDKQ